MILSHLNGSDLKFPELGLREAKPHFDAQPGQRPIFTQHEDASAVAEALIRLRVTSTCAVVGGGWHSQLYGGGPCYFSVSPSPLVFSIRNN